MNFHDLTPKTNPKGGEVFKGPKTPVPFSMKGLTPNEQSNGHISVWRAIAFIEASILATGVAAWFTFGLDSVKHSEIDAIMATRAPYMHDYKRIWDKFEEVTSQATENKANLKVIDERLRTLEIKHQ